MGKEEKDKVLEKICDMKEDLVECMEKDIASGEWCKDAEALHIAGETVDMIKDLAEAEEKIEKACYYKTVTKAMKEYDEDEEEGPYGYDHYHLANGQFARKGSGHRVGYMRTLPDHMMREPWEPAEIYGYDRMGRGNRSQSGNMRSGYGPDGSYGSAYQRYLDSRRNYTETRSEADKEEMKRHGKEHVTHAVMTLEEIWETADPELKQRMKTDIDHLRSKMN